MELFRMFWCHQNMEYQAHKILVVLDTDCSILHTGYPLLHTTFQLLQSRL